MKIDNNFSPILRPAIRECDENIASHSLQELYEIKKNRLGLSDRAIQKLLGIQLNSLKPILEGTAKQINLVNFIKLANFIGLEFEQLASSYLPTMDADVIGEIQDARDAGYLVEMFDLQTLKKCGFLTSENSTKNIVSRIKKFFNLKSLYDFASDDLGRAFSRTKKTSNEKMREFWIRSAYTQFISIDNPNKYSRSKLIEIIPKIKPYSRNEEYGLITVAKALYSIGVTVIYQPCLSKEQVRGATLCINEKPCIVISDLGKKYPTLWFSLMHELYHVLYDLEDISRKCYHISSDYGDLMLTNEDRADYFAQQILLSDDKLNFIEGYINSHINVLSYAQQWGIHPSIIYSTYCYKYDAWAKFNKYIPNTTKALKTINMNPFESSELVQNAKQIKKLLIVNNYE